MIYWRSALILHPVAYAYKEVVIGFLALSGCSSNFYHTMAVQGHKRLWATSRVYEVLLKGMFEKKKMAGNFGSCPIAEARAAGTGF